RGGCGRLSRPAAPADPCALAGPARGGAADCHRAPMSGCGRGGPVIRFPVMLALGSLTIAVPTSAQSSAALQEQNYDIPPQPLRTALARFARISRVDILYDDGLATGRKSAAVQGWLTPQQALEALLTRT